MFFETRLPDGDRMRVVLRQPKTELYVQVSGELGGRESAQSFASSLVAYYWAKEQPLLGLEVLLAFADPAYDFVTMRT